MLRNSVQQRKCFLFGFDARHQVLEDPLLVIERARLEKGETSDKIFQNNYFPLPAIKTISFVVLKYERKYLHTSFYTSFVGVSACGIEVKNSLFFFPSHQIEETATQFSLSLA